jgi:hypothetical protein
VRTEKLKKGKIKEKREKIKEEERGVRTCRGPHPVDPNNTWQGGGLSFSASATPLKNTNGCKLCDRGSVNHAVTGGSININKKEAEALYRITTQFMVETVKGS